MSEYRLKMQGVVKTFPGVRALDYAQLELTSGKIMALMGENGAGKSTLMKCMFGIYKMDEGEIFYEGEKVTIANPLDALERGIAMVHQELQPIPARSVGENIWLGRYPTKFGFVDHEKMYNDTQKLLDKLKIDIDPRAKLQTLSIAQMQMVEIAKACSANCKVLILDEPTSSLTANEVESLFRIMRELRDQGVALVYISHKMDEIKVIADEVTIMRDGGYIGKWEVAKITKEEIIAQMVGRELSNLFPARENEPEDEIVLKVEGFTSIHPRSFRNCNFDLHKGEILGVAGLVGAQRTELMEGIFGLRAHNAGEVYIKGEKVEITRPRDAIHKSLALLTEDRRATGILGVLSVADNISIASLDALRKGLFLDNKAIIDLVMENKEKMSIKVPSPKTAIKSLSGGNQQKVLIARWLANNPDILILDEPTRGIDVGAKYEIYCIITELAKQGKSIIMISSEMSEIIGMSDRVMVMCDGRITGFIPGGEATQENIMELATQFESVPDAVSVAANA
ncbi:MAG: sugar ABC transporter ATP-binding protein [Faecalibacterium sp.]